MIGRRVATIEGIERPGDYCGPIMGYTGDRPAVFYHPPNRSPEHAKTMIPAHVCSPKHTFTEQPDGSLQILPSILHTKQEHGYDWHGYLDPGHSWRTV